MEDYPRPENMDYLQSPRVNPEIWRKIKPYTKSRDIAIQRAQTRIVKGLTPLARALPLLTNMWEKVGSISKADLDHVLKLLLASVACTILLRLNCLEMTFPKPWRKSWKPTGLDLTCRVLSRAGPSLRIRGNLPCIPDVTTLMDNSRTGNHFTDIVVVTRNNFNTKTGSEPVCCDGSYNLPGQNETAAWGYHTASNQLQ